MNEQKELVAHLMRRAGFGATKQEIESLASSLEYENIVDSLVTPSDKHSLPEDLIRRYHVDQNEMRLINSAVGKWVYKMVTTKAPLIEKMSLFWHGLFATGYSKVFHGQTMYSQIKMFRNHGMGSFSNLLLKLSQDPAMLYWLDNHDNHASEINENYGRELLELFSMSIGNYTEDDVKECSRSFTGWTIQNSEYMGLRAQSASIWPYSQIAWQHEYVSSDHDNGTKTFLGETGNFNGEDIIEIICKHSATADFISRRLYQYFVADEIDSDGESLIRDMVKSYFKSNYEISEVLSLMFNSAHFKSEKIRYSRVKSPVELVIGTLRLAEEFEFPNLKIIDAARSIGYMGQQLLNPPSVEGWHEGVEWLDSGTLLERVNFASKYLGNPNQPCISAVISHFRKTQSPDITVNSIVEKCLNQLGYFYIDEQTKQDICGSLSNNYNNPEDQLSEIATDAIRLIVSSKEFQMA
ncbi:MAG: DUF1800 domain-containing protein [SAR202 cluster bacterium]|nr:DUF1800 domain-containing protein [SAR202 cluster bacterium]|tara:strand:- start:4538 stop:5935 length:1398 start_codon:yes stop_codon:yes gene_type:complete